MRSMCPLGHAHASAVDSDSATMAAHSSTGEGRTDQKKPSCVRAEKSVRKSDTDTWKGAGGCAKGVEDAATGRWEGVRTGEKAW